MQEGRQAASDRRAATRADRVNAYRAWAKHDADLWMAFREGRITREQRVARSTSMPELPSKKDFAVVDGYDTEEDDA
jgi:hypothetical protein